MATLRTLGYVIWLFGYMGLRLPIYVKCRRLVKQGRQKESETIFYAEVRRWTRKLFKLVGIRVHIEGEENLPAEGETVLFVANHQSYIDIPVFLSDLGKPRPIMAKRELSRVPFLGLWMKLLGCVFVEREDIRAAAAAMKEAEERLLAGYSMIICPEGTRSKSRQMLPFKGGSVRMALRAKVPIVPVAVEGTYKVLEGNNYRAQGADVRMVILPRVETEGLSKAEQKELPAKLHDMILLAKDGPEALEAERQAALPE